MQVQIANLSYFLVHEHDLSLPSGHLNDSGIIIMVRIMAEVVWKLVENSSKFLNMI